jgi:hypothetical protein
MGEGDHKDFLEHGLLMGGWRVDEVFALVEAQIWVGLACRKLLELGRSFADLVQGCRAIIALI